MKSGTVLSLTVGLIAFALAACDAGGSPLETGPAVTSDSFSPVVGKTAAGAAGDVWWKYRLNGGAAVPITSMGVPGTMKLSDETVRASDGGTKRSSTFGLTIVLNDGSTAVTTTGTATHEDVLMAGPPNAVVSETINEDEVASGGGETLRLVLSSMATPSMALVDFGDRTDLDQVAVGHTDEATVTTMISATATATVNGSPSTNTTTGTSRDHETWKVAEQIPSMTVQGKTYQRVVRVQVESDSTDTSTNAVTTSSKTLWLAAGVGAIKSIETNSLLPTQITYELVDTNLGAP